MKIYQALARAFDRERVAACFALLGDANMHWAGALSELDVHCIYTRHEHAAVAGAAAYARESGQIGVASVTCGPGLTQIMTILPIAVRARIPMIIFAGEAPLKKAWYNQGIDQAPFVNACGADYVPLHDTATMVADVHQAFAQARRKRIPVVLGVPLDLQQESIEETANAPVSSELYTVPAPLQPDPAAITEAANWIARAKKPVLLAGLGVVSAGARESCIALAKRSGACLATTLPAKGLFHDQDFCLGVAGGFSSEEIKAIFAEADLVIGVGARLAAHTFDGGSLTPEARVIHLDIEPRKSVQGRKAADLMISADARLGADALCEAVDQRAGWRDADMQRRTAEALQIPDVEVTPDGALHPLGVVSRLAQIIPADCHIVNTSGHSAYYSAQMNGHPQSHYTVIRDFGAIGNGTSFALGVATACPERSVVLLDGDGSAMMNIQELETIQRHQMKILMVVFNDGAYGSEVHKLRAENLTEAGSVFGRPDFAGIARGFGWVGHTITDLDKLESAMQEFLAGESPVLWDLHISDQVASPQILKAHRATQSN